MTQEDKELLIKDLCCRVPYNTVVSIGYLTYDGLKWVDEPLTLLLLQSIEEEDSWEYVKPYLRQMSNMTDEERKEFDKLCETDGDSWMGNHRVSFPKRLRVIDKCVNWLNKKMFDYRGLIPNGLAETAPEGMYNS